MKKLLKRLGHVALIVLIMFLIFVMLKLIAYSLPSSNIKSNVQLSFEQLEKEGLYPRIFGGGTPQLAGLQLDNWTDSSFLNVAYCADDRNPMEAMAGDYFGIATENRTDPLYDFAYTVENDGNNPRGQYMRQWFGMEVYLRPLLCIFTISEIRILTQFIMLTLLLIATVHIERKIDRKTAFAFFAGILSANIVIVSSSVNFYGAFFIILLAAIFIPVLNSKFSEFDLMLIIGGSTAFLDLFAMPFATFPIITMLIVMKKNREYTGFAFKENIKLLFRCAVGWIMGYIILWGGKWVLASLVLKTNCFRDAWLEMVNAGTMRPEWGPDTTIEMIRQSLKLNWGAIFPINLIQILNQRYGINIGVLLIALFFVGNIYVVKRYHLCLNKSSYLVVILLLAVAPYGYFIIMNAHSFVHYWFSYRSQCATVMGIILVSCNLWERRESKAKIGGEL